MKNFKIALFLGKQMTNLWENLACGFNFVEAMREAGVELDCSVDGNVIVREFDTQAELDAYLQGAADTDGWDHQAWCFSNEIKEIDYSLEYKVKDLIAFCQFKHLGDDEGLDLCRMDGGGTGYLIGCRELRWPTVEGNTIFCESNNVHEKDENGEDIEGQYISVAWADMTESERDELYQYLLEFARWDGE